jgi:hypothetical protein
VLQVVFASFGFVHVYPCVVCMVSLGHWTRDLEGERIQRGLLLPSSKVKGKQRPSRFVPSSTMAAQRKNATPATSSRSRYAVQHATSFDGLKIEGEDESEEGIEESEDEEVAEKSVPIPAQKIAQTTEDVV